MTERERTRLAKVSGVIGSVSPPLFACYLVDQSTLLKASAQWDQP